MLAFEMAGGDPLSLPPVFSSTGPGAPLLPQTPGLRPAHFPVGQSDPPGPPGLATATATAAAATRGSCPWEAAICQPQCLAWTWNGPDPPLLKGSGEAAALNRLPGQGRPGGSRRRSNSLVGLCEAIILFRLPDVPFSGDWEEKGSFLPGQAKRCLVCPMPESCAAAAAAAAAGGGSGQGWGLPGSKSEGPRKALFPPPIRVLVREAVKEAPWIKRFFAA